MPSTDPYSHNAGDYAKYRPAYAREAIRDLAVLTGLDPSWSVADVGSGTGNLSRHLVHLCRHIHAIEPSDAMRRHAERLLGHHAGFQSVAGTAERTSLADRSVELITVGQALHWFDAPRATREFRRILKPSGLLATVWNQFEGGAEGPIVDEWFDPQTCEQRSFPAEIRETWEAFIGGARSAASAPAPGDPNYAEFENAHREMFDSRASDGRIVVRYTTELVVGRLRIPPAVSELPPGA